MQSDSDAAPIDADELLRVVKEGDAIQLWRWDAAKPGYRYVGAFDPDAFPVAGILEFTRQRYGGGKFKARILQANRQYGQSRVFDVDGPPGISESAPPDIPQALTVPGKGSAGIPGWVEKIVIPIGATFATAFGTLIAKRLMESPTQDPLLLELVRQLAQRPAAEPTSQADTVALMNQLLELQDKLRERVAETHGTSSNIGGVGGAIERNFPALVDLMNRKLDLDERRLIPSDATAPTDTGAPDTEDATMNGNGAAPSRDPLVGALTSLPRIARQVLLGAAENGESPELYAELALGKLDAATYGLMPGFLARADFVDVFIRVHPAFAAYRPWVDDFAAAMQASLAAVDSTSSDTAGPSSDEPGAT